MIPPTINHEDALARFSQLLQRENNLRVMRLLGEGEMGKTHLLSKVLPAVLRQHSHVTPAWFTLENQNISSHLNNACSQLEGNGDVSFAEFHQAYQSWINRPRIQANNLIALLSKMTVSSRDEKESERDSTPMLTRSFVEGLRRLQDRVVLLVFDTVATVDEATLRWLMETLLVQTHHLPHVRTIIAGRRLPDAAGIYSLGCDSYELRPVRETSAYVDFCRKVGATMSEESITDFAYALDYCPGAFAKTVLRKFVSRSSSHG